ncbi:MAG: helix-turn-helix transcriptional regulator [Flavobacteriaceae bacterium]|nr:helix-turn-helix transcriptional regulator [Flavobacteriaceae bacterium]
MNLFLLTLSLLTLFIAGGLYFKEQKLKNLSISIFTLLFGLEILYFISGTTEMALAFPYIRGRFYFSIGFLYGPILLFHFQSIILGKTKIERKDFLHFLPLIVLNVSMLDIIMMSTVERNSYFENVDNFFNRIIYLNYARSAHQILYAVLLIRLFFKYKPAIDVNKKFYLGAFSIIYIITTVVISLLTVFASGWQDFKMYYTLCTLLVLIIGYILYTEPNFFKAIKIKYQNSGISEVDLEKIRLKIQHLFAEKHTYLDNNLTIDSLATLLDVKKHHVSQMFTNIQKENFNDFVNRHRVEYAKSLLKDKNFKQYKIEAIAQEAGFNNKVTFYKAFSKFTNTTPSLYRKELSKE